jgi:glutamyl-Q tRNA(Asp) synthetase
MTDLPSEQTSPRPKLRFAPSPNGLLHLGHALSALVNFDAARKINGDLLLRMEDIDTVRCTEPYEDAICEDLAWLGIHWTSDIRRQSEHFDTYAEVLETLRHRGLIYPATLSRSALRKMISDTESAGKIWPRDPDGAPLYPAGERDMDQSEVNHLIESDQPFAWRLNMKRALADLGNSELTWQELNADLSEAQDVKADASAWGDVVLARKDTPTSYHLSVVVDDELQGITHVFRGSDLAPATAVHRVLQQLLDFDVPDYYHHDLILGDDGLKLSKSRDDTSLASLRASGLTPQDIRKMVGL